uniref:ATP synthase F0 subunit 6 n=1 Tax=Rhinebothrium fulbrighti TaxID=1008294 RepID=A0A8K1W5U0_9CEST|nr:ATP synthase F0 subunit 6 [Rhinebothrium fulbrighti]
MFSNFTLYSSLFLRLYNLIIQRFSYYYSVLLSCLLVLFLVYRFPYCYSPLLFCALLIVIVLSLFLSLFLRRVFASYNNFFSEFVPVGTPLYICPLVCLAESISYLIRPFVLIFRPFINISLGCYGAVALSGFCFSNNACFIAVGLVFFYEVFVALVHWFIVTSILSFSVEH